VNWNKVISWVFVALFAAVAGWAGLFFLEMNRELTVLRAQAASNERKLADARRRLAEQEKYLEALRRDPELVERVIRRKLGYVRSSEFVFRFDDPKSLP
jgi:cell division protein FtsB